jgi:hypothetical protein
MDDPLARLQRLITDLALVHALMDAAQSRFDAAAELHDPRLPRLRKDAIEAAELVVAVQGELLKALKEVAEHVRPRPGN